MIYEHDDHRRTFASAILKGLVLEKTKKDLPCTSTSRERASTTVSTRCASAGFAATPPNKLGPRTCRDEILRGRSRPVDDEYDRLRPSSLSLIHI